MCCPYFAALCPFLKCEENLPDYLGMPVSPSGYSPFILFHLGTSLLVHFVVKFKENMLIEPTDTWFHQWFGLVYRLWPLCSLYPPPRRLKCSDQWTLPLLGCQAETWRRPCPTWRLFNALQVDLKTRWAREPKSKTAHSTPFFLTLWCGQLCSARNRRKIFTETSCALMVWGATIHHSMLCQLRLHSSSRYFC